MSYEDTNDQKNYEVGYRKPPKSGQFRKGQSGNPDGGSARRRKAKSAFANPFQEKLADTVEVLENGRPVRRTRKHVGVRRLVEAAATGDIQAIREIFELQRAPDPSPSVDDFLAMTLSVSLAVGPPEVVLHDPNTIVIRDPPPTEAGKADVPASNPASKQRRRKRVEEPRDQTWKSLVLFELERRIKVTSKTTGMSRMMTMLDVILEQLATAFANGKKGAMKLAVQLNEMVKKRPKKLKKVVHIPHDYIIPPKCDDPRGWPPGHPHHYWKDVR